MHGQGQGTETKEDPVVEGVIWSGAAGRSILQDANGEFWAVGPDGKRVKWSKEAVADFMQRVKQ